MFMYRKTVFNYEFFALNTWLPLCQVYFCTKCRTGEIREIIGLIVSKRSLTMLLFSSAMTGTQGKKRKDTVCIVLADDTCEEAKIRMNKVCNCP